VCRYRCVWCVSLRRTVDEAQAGPGQDVLLQVVLLLPPARRLQDLPPAQHRPAEHQEVTAAGAAQSLFGLEITEKQRYTLKRTRETGTEEDQRDGH